MNGMTNDIYFDLKGKDNDANTKILLIGIKSLCKIHTDHPFLFQIYFKETKKITRFHRGIGHPHYEALFEGKPRAGLASMNLG